MQDNRVNVMTIEILAFFVIAASLVLVGFVTGPMVARRVHASNRFSHHPHLYH